MLESVKLTGQKYADVRYSDTLSNIKYAPGFATYGLRGESGKSGEDSPYFYICDISYNSALPEPVLDLINSNKPLSSRDTLVHEFIGYKPGDLVLMHDGSVYRIIENREQNAEANLNILKYELILTKIFTIENDTFKPDSVDDVAAIGINGADPKINQAPVAVDATSTNGKAVKMFFRDQNNTVNSLSIEYDQKNKCWCFVSDNTIVMNSGGLEIGGSSNTVLDNHTSILSLKNANFESSLERLSSEFKFKTDGIEHNTSSTTFDKPTFDSIMSKVSVMSASVLDSSKKVEEYVLEIGSKIVSDTKAMTTASAVSNYLSGKKPSLASGKTILTYNFYVEGVKYTITGI